MLRLSRSVRRGRRLQTPGRMIGLVVATAVIAAACGIAGSLVATTPVAASTAASFTLASQSPWIGAPGTFSIVVNVSSDLPPARLGLEFVLYSKLSSRSAYAQTTANAVLPFQTCLHTSPLMPVGTAGGGSTRQTVPVRINVKTSSAAPSCGRPTTTFTLDCQAGQCDGVYPLSVALIDRSRPTQPVASFTTHVVIASARAGAFPLKVGLVAQLGGQPSLAPDGSPALKRPVSALSAEVQALTATRTHLAVTLSPDLLLALARMRSTQSLRGAIDSFLAHGRAGARVELLSASFTQIDASALAANGLGGDVAPAIAAGQSELAAHFGHAIPAAPYVSLSPLGSQGLEALQRACLNEFVVPESSISALAGSQRTPTAPFIVGHAVACGSTLQPPIAFVSDTTLNAELSTRSSDPILAGENVLGDLAQVYFEGPFDPDPRAVVAIANEFADPRLLQVVMNGLRDNPILSTSQLSRLFATVPPGSSGNLASAVLDGSSGGDAPGGAAVATSKGLVKIVKATMPNNRSLISRLNSSVITAEAAGLSNADRLAYLDAPRQALVTIGKAITIVGSGIVTLTSRSGKIQITIRSEVAGAGPIHIVFHLSSSQLVLPTPTSQRLDLTSKDTPQTVSVQTRTSGSSDLEVVVYSATGGFPLSRREIIVRSTAVSGVAIALSAAALIVLVAWWVRSTVRTRRRRAASRAVEA